MAKAGSGTAKEKLVTAATDLIRRNGYVATTVDQICEQAGVTKGAFFHHFNSKEEVAESALENWDRMGAALAEGAAFHRIEDPTEKLLGCMDFYVRLFSNAKLLKSCLAGTIVQEVSDSHPVLREAANSCFVSGGRKFQALIDAAAKQQKRKLDTGSLASLWMAALQGSLILSKASQDGSVIAASLKHVRDYISLLLGSRETGTRKK